jgi:hypothetical protein
MRNLRLVGLSNDGRQVVFVDDAGVEFLAPADDRLRAALRGDRARLGQLEIEMESALRPRDIQARIRAGSTPESVAAIAGAPVERIMAYCVPVLAERRHVAETAGRSHVRRANADGQSRPLRDLVAERLRSRGVDLETVEWDSWRRDDGRWTVTIAYFSGESGRSAAFVFDPSGRYSLAEDDEARWLTGERQSSVHGPQPRDAHAAALPDRRLAVVPRADEDLLSLASTDYLGIAESHDLTASLDEPAHPADGETSDDLTAVVRAVREPADATTESAVDATAAAAAGAVGEELGPSEATPAQPQVERRAGRRGRAAKRATVPSWDEIMLGRRVER